MDGLGGVLRFEEEKLSNDYGGGVIGDGAIDADDALFEETREDVVGALAAGGVLDDHGNEAVGAGGDAGAEGAGEAGAPPHRSS